MLLLANSETFHMIPIYVCIAPFERFGQHRCRKSRKIGMVIFDETKSDYPEAELKALESNAIYNYCVKKGTPKWQKGASTFSGA